jgi:hypothetical protein
VTPYTQNFNLSVTTAVSNKVTVDLRYIGTRSVKQQSSVNLNINNVYFNPELFSALEMTRQGLNAPLFDEMLAGLNLNPNTPGYGAIGTCVTAASGAPGAGQEGCAAGQVRQHGSAHLRRSATFRGDLANGNFLDVAEDLMGNGPTGTTGLQSLPTVNGETLTGISNRRLLRNGCDRLAAGLTNIPTRCFAEDYMVMNPQLGNPTFVTNGNSSNYHSLQTQVTLRPTFGINMQGTYTWSRNLGISGTATDPTNRRGDYALTANDRRHDFRLNGTVELPIGPNKFFFGNTSGWVARIIERWQTSMIFNWNSGTPTDITAQDMLYDNGTPDIVGPSHSRKAEWSGTEQTTRPGRSMVEPILGVPTHSSPSMTHSARASLMWPILRATICSTGRMLTVRSTPSPSAIRTEQLVRLFSRHHSPESAGRSDGAPFSNAAFGRLTRT